MNIGDLIESLESDEDAEAALLSLGDLVLHARVLVAGERHGESAAAYTAGAVGRFSCNASDADWVTLLGAMERSPEPGQAFLETVLRWALARDASEEQVLSRCGSCASGEGPELGHGEAA